MVDEHIIHDIFPHRKDDGGPSYRENQFEVIRDTLSAFESGFDDVVIEAPTGTGKTDIAKTVAMYMTRGFDVAFSRVSHLVPSARGNSAMMRDSITPVLAPNQAHMITSMKMLQDAYLHTRGHVCLVKGKNNYDCHDRPEEGVIETMAASFGLRTRFSCEESQMLRGYMCKNCPYADAKFAAQTSAIALFNFDSFINQVSLPPEDMSSFSPRALLTIDEGHNTEEKLANSMSMEFTEAMFKRLNMFWNTPVDDSMDSAEEWMKVTSQLIGNRMTPALEEMSEMKKGKLTMAKAKRQAELAREINRLQDMSSRVNRFLRSRGAKKPVDWVMDVEDSSVRLEPVTARPFMHHALLMYGEKRLHLSATFLDGNGVYRKSVRLNPGTTKYVAVPSTFPVENRPIYVRSVGDLGYRTFDAKLPDIANEIQSIMDENHGVRGLIHCTSYKLAEQIRDRVKDPRLVFHGKDDREEVVNNFMTSQASDLVLVGVSLTEGYDFKGDLCRFQILIKVPYPYPTKRVRERVELQPKYMDWRTCLTMVQSYGRGMRSASDWCRTYVLDGRFEGFVSRNRRQLPSWFKDAIER